MIRRLRRFWFRPMVERLGKGNRSAPCKVSAPLAAVQLWPSLRNLSNLRILLVLDS
jgi:hypothetical protein